MEKTKSPPPITAWFVDDESSLRKSVAQSFMLADVALNTAAAAAELLPDITASFAGVIITDINMPGMSGLEFFNKIKEIDPDIPVILVTGHGDISMAVEAIRHGAYDFIEKPFSVDELVDITRRAMEKRCLTLENRQLRQDLADQDAPGPRILGKTAATQRLRATLKTILETPADILLQGETGVGKELVSRYLHEQSHRRRCNFVAINCGAVPENLIESELFGHESGAFTGADKLRIGKFEHANGGTLFLDEIESMPMTLQVKILRVLEERQVERLGSNKLVPLNIRIIAATKVDLKALADAGEFRQDLYYRLNVVSVMIPPLRERIEDVPLLFEHFTLIASARYQREIIPLSPARRLELMQHQWPGNVRELRNMAERYVIMGEENTFDLAETNYNDELQGRLTLPEKVEMFERSLIETSLARCQGNIKEVMVELGLPRKTLYDKLKKYSLSRNHFLNGEMGAGS